MEWSGRNNVSGQQEEASGRWERRQLKLKFSYRFGSTKIKAARQRKTGMEDEKNRVKGK